MATTWQIEERDTYLYVQVVGSYGGVDEAAAGLTAIVERCRAAQR